MGALWANNAVAALTAPISAQATVLFVDTENAPLFPTPGAGEYFVITLEDRTQTPIAREIIRVSQRLGEQFTVQRAVEGTVALAWAAGTTVSNRLTAGEIGGLGGTTGANGLFLGEAETPPTKDLANKSLVKGNTYIDHASKQLFEYDGIAWKPVTGSNGLFGLYLGAFTAEPQRMADNKPLVAGALYFDKTVLTLRTYDGTAWTKAAPTSKVEPPSDLPPGSTTVPGDQTVHGNQIVDGNETVGGDLTVGDDISCHSLTASASVSASAMFLNGREIVDMGDFSGTANSQRLPNGMKMQWGVAGTDGGGNATVTFGEPFSSQASVVMLTPRSPDNAFASAWVALIHGPPTASTVNVVSVNGGGRFGPIGFSWWAIGPA